MKGKILVTALLFLVLTTTVSAANNTTTDSKTSILDKEWSFDYCQSYEESIQNEDCNEKSFKLHPYRLVVYGFLGFLAIGVLAKFWRVWVKGEPF